MDIENIVWAPVNSAANWAEYWTYAEIGGYLLNVAPNYDEETGVWPEDNSYAWSVFSYDADGTQWELASSTTSSESDARTLAAMWAYNHAHPLPDGEWTIVDH